MEDKTGAIDSVQFHQYLKKLHSMIHWLLIYKEQDDDALATYFDSVQDHIQGLNALLNNPPEIMELLVSVECARREFLKGKCCSYKKYRRIVLDAHAIIDRITIPSEKKGGGLHGQSVSNKNGKLQKPPR